MVVITLKCTQLLYFTPETFTLYTNYTSVELGGESTIILIKHFVCGGNLAKKQEKLRQDNFDKNETVCT